MTPSQSLTSQAMLSPTLTESSLAGADAGKVLSRYRPALVTFLRRKGFSSEEADDLTQETLIRAYTHLHSFRGESPAAWLYRIAGNVAIDHLRKQRLSTISLDTLTQAPLGEELDLLAGVVRSQNGAAIADVIKDLPPCHQRILRLRFYQDCSLAEIAALMNCSTMAAKLRVFRAVTALRKRCALLGTEREALAG
jgi:RNA polymerase sigma-70 factor (ECF subfamily)